MSVGDRDVLPPGWAWATLAEIAQIKGGITKGQKRKPTDVIRSVPYLRVANVQRGYLDLSEVKEIEATESEIEELKLVPGDVLFTEGGDRDKLGRGWIWRGEIGLCIHQNHIFRARLKSPELHAKLISWYGNTAGQDYFARQGKQTTNLASINLTKLAAFPIPIPPANEQRRIVAEIEAHVSRIDAGMADLEQVRAKLRRQRAAVLKAACEGRLVPTEVELARAEGRDYEPADRLLARVAQVRRARWEADQLAKMTAQGKTPKGEAWRSKYQEPDAPPLQERAGLPEGWAWATVEQVTSAVQYGSSEKTDENPEGVPVLRMGNIVDGRLDLGKLKYLPVEHREFPDLLLDAGDLLFNRTNSAELVGKTAVYRGIPSPCSFASYLIRVRLIDGIMPDLLAYYLNSTLGRAWIASVVTQQVGQANVNGTKLQALAIPVPPAAEQARIVAEVERRLSLIDDLEAVVSANLKRAGRLRQAILKRAFEGKLVPQDPADEPAKALLARIGRARGKPPRLLPGM